jgi:7,8-dihydropterin-6-yl-methyl-4-(beta-D-ribofuranosyl)aminobenzene 5'-phosphate synthase
VLENTLVESEGDAGASPDHLTDAERLGRLVSDQHPDEHATRYIVQGRGLVVISSCGHVGLIQHDKSCHGGVGGRQAACGARRVSSWPGAAGLCRSHGSRARVAVTRRGHPDALQRRQVSAAMHRQIPGNLVTGNIGSRFTFGV